MHRSRAWLVIVGVLAAAGAATLALQWQAGAALRRELALLRADHRELLRLRDENRELTKSQVSPAELENLRADHVALVRLRADLEALKHQPVLLATGTPAPAAAKLIPASDWKNAGRATPAAAFETILWAAKGGDIDQLSRMLRLDFNSRTKAEAILAGLPDEMRATYSTPERLVALLGSKDAAVEAMQVLETKEFNPDASALVVQVEDSKSNQRRRTLVFMRDPEGWRLNVPADVVERYGKQLQAAAAAER